MVLAFAIFATAGCDQRSAAASRGPQPAPAEVRIGYFPNVTHAQAVLAVASGDFAKAVAPAKLTTRTFNAGPELMEALFGGQIDIAYVGPGPALSAYAKSNGEGIRVIAGAAANGVIIVARPQANIHSPSDLAGKKIATPQYGNTQDISCRHFLKDILHQADLNNVVPAPNANQAAMISRGEIDAAWVPEPWGSLLIAQTGAVPVFEEKDVWPSHQFSLTLIVTTPTFLAEHPDVVKKILAVHRDWTQKLQTSPEAYAPQLAQAIFQLTHKPLPAAVVLSSLKRTTFTTDPLPDTIHSMAQWSVDLGFVKRVPNLDALTDTTILKSLQ